MRTGLSLMAIVLFTAATPAWAQKALRDTEADTEVALTSPLAPVPSVGRTADTAAGRVGERRSREQVDGVGPMGRVNNRIQNRVQARLRNRIDRNYDPRANATSPFTVAGDAAQSSSQRP